ncbi:hypothetical protein FQA39_LY09588 [Lamprigera yunnana]|nr:hypothetical protein FQA39_LY09588 [Lamprigera yunnana]
MYVSVEISLLATTDYSFQTSYTIMEVKEFEIPVPWGHIAAKSWGDDRNGLVLMVHGSRDNAGSFDRLIQYLPKHFYYLCIDLPGHGQSSYFPESILINQVNYIMALRLVAEYTNRKKLILVGHSWGGQLVILFTQLYPEIVEKLILIESVYYSLISVEYFKQFTREHLDYGEALLKKVSKGTPPAYSYKDILKLTMNNRLLGTLKSEAAEALLKRNLKQVGNDLYVLTNDLRIKVRQGILLDMEFAIKFIKKNPIMCPILFLLAKKSIPIKEVFKDVLSIIKNHNSKCFVKELDGDHEMHNNTPEIVAPEISNFLNMYNSNL